jgi:hypothetical protein
VRLFTADVSEMLHAPLDPGLDVAGFISATFYCI